MNRARFLGLFLDEARQHLTQARAALERFRSRPQSPDTLAALMRHCHSMKGMAATMGFEPFVELAHRMEGLLRELEDRPRMWSDELTPLFAEGLEHLGAWAEQIGEGHLPEHDVATRTLVARLDSLLNEQLGAERSSSGTRPEEHNSDPELWSVRLSLQVSSASPTHRILSTLKRVGAFGRVQRVRPPQLPLDQTPAAMDIEFELASRRPPQTLRHRLSQLAWVTSVDMDPIARGPRTRTRIEMPSEWTRVPAESLDWIADNLRELALRHTLGKDESRSADDPGGYLIKRVYDRVAELRLVPMMSLGHRLEPAVRDAARRDGKLVRFALTGGDVGLERGLLDRLVDPLRHLVRNAVVHGIEPPAERKAIGKPAEGLIRLTVALHGDRLHLDLTDDGRGMDAAALRQAAVAAGEIGAAEAETLTEKASFLLAFRSAVTTKVTADRLSGRGVGLDVVADEFRSLDATIDLASVTGEGSRFSFDLPMRRAIVGALVFSRAGQTFAIPMKAIRRAVCAGVPPLGAQVLDLVSDAPAPSEDGFYLELDRTEDPIALVADEVLGRRELWLQPLARPFAEKTYVNGAAITDNGSLALMIDPAKLSVPEPVAG
jgi:two-component system chemotaxis sensor kinase CheA